MKRQERRGEGRGKVGRAVLGKVHGLHSRSVLISPEFSPSSTLRTYW